MGGRGAAGRGVGLLPAARAGRGALAGSGRGTAVDRGFRRGAQSDSQAHGAASTVSTAHADRAAGGVDGVSRARLLVLVFRDAMERSGTHLRGRRARPDWL